MPQNSDMNKRTLNVIAFALRAEQRGQKHNNAREWQTTMAAWNKAVGVKNLVTIMHALILIIYLGPQTGRIHLD